METPQKSTEQIPLIQPRSFNIFPKQHLINRLKPDQNGQILLENFLSVKYLNFLKLLFRWSLQKNIVLNVIL